MGRHQCYVLPCLSSQYGSAWFLITRLSTVISGSVAPTMFAIVQFIAGASPSCC